jgi:hypothetical protein
MADNKKSWNELAEDDDKQLGVSKDVLRKLMQMNPTLRGGQSTEDLMKSVKSTLGQSGSAGQTAAAPKAVAPAPKTVTAAPKTTASAPKAVADVLDVVTNARAEFERETQRFEAELKKLKTERDALVSRLCLGVIDQCLAIDPNLLSPKTQLVLKDEKAFLDKIGFTVQKMIERQKTKPK